MGCHESRQREIQEKRIRVLGFQEVKQYKIYPNFSGISPNEKYLAYPIQNNINVVNLQSSMKIKQFKIIGEYKPFVFHLDYFAYSRMVSCHIDSPRIKIYRADNDYKQINSIQALNRLIRGLKIITQNLILSCDERSTILVIDYTKKCQILRKKLHHDHFNERHVEFASQNQVIVTHQGSSINFYKMNGDTAISHSDTLIYDRIEIIQNTNRLISRHKYSLVLWLMDYKQKELIKLREFYNEIQISGTQFLIQQKLIMLDGQFIIILDMKDFKITYRQRHHLNYDDFVVRYTIQLTITSNHLFIRSFSSVEILKIIMMWSLIKIKIYFIIFYQNLQYSSLFLNYNLNINANDSPINKNYQLDAQIILHKRLLQNKSKCYYLKEENYNVFQVQ